MRVFSLKVRDDDPVAVFLAAQPNKSEAIYRILAMYLSSDDGGKPGRPEPAPVDPDPTNAALIESNKKLRKTIKKWMRLVAGQRVGNAALNECETAKPKVPKLAPPPPPPSYEYNEDEDYDNRSAVTEIQEDDEEIPRIKVRAGFLDDINAGLNEWGKG